MVDGMPDFMKEVLLRGCNNQIDEFNTVCNHLSQYSVCTILLVPKKYEERIVNELELLNTDFNTPIAYDINEAEDDNIGVTLFNMGVIQKEAILKSLNRE